MQVVDSPAAVLYSLNTVGTQMLLVGDETIVANTTTDQARFCATAIAVINV